MIIDILRLKNQKSLVSKKKDTKVKKISKFIINETWVVRQFENDYNPIHWHSGHVSGVGYLKVPKILGQESKDGKKT